MYKINPKLAACVALSVGVITTVTNAYGATKGAQKNVLFIAVDDLKPILGCYGHKGIHTPNIDALAARGTMFSSAYCQLAISSASRASLLTGLSPDRIKIWDLKSQFRNTIPDVVTLPQCFRQSGYQVMGAGKIFDPRTLIGRNDEQSWSLPFVPLSPLVDDSYGGLMINQYQSDEIRTIYNEEVAKCREKGITERNEIFNYLRPRIKPSVESADVSDHAYMDGAMVLTAIEMLNNRDKSKPFFLAAGFNRPHLPFNAPKKYWDLYDRASIPLDKFQSRAEGTSDYAYHEVTEMQAYTDVKAVLTPYDNIINAIPEDKQRELIHGYYACVSYVDALIGDLISALEQSGESEDTIIILWSDHGWHLGDHALWCKHSCFEQATRVPMIIVDPSSKGRTTNSPVELLDIYPTLCSLAGIQAPEGLDGDDLSPAIRDQISFDKIGVPYAVSQFARESDKYERKAMGYSVRNSRYRYTVWFDWEDRNLDFGAILAEELYDYKSDKNERYNLVDDKRHTKQLELMRSYWEEYKSTSNRF